jgi:DNA-binding NarL/FixJ family response regulator
MLDRIATGRTDHEIGEEFDLADVTATSSVFNLFAKLGKGRRSVAPAYAGRLVERWPGTGQ